jgi:serine protease Do
MDVVKRTPPKPAKSSAGKYSTKNQAVNFGAMKNKMDSGWAGNKIWLVALLLMACLLFGFGGGWLGARTYSHGNTLLSTSTAAKQQYISNESELVESIAKNVGQSVVSVDVKGRTATQNFFGILEPQQTQSAGTGFIISSSGIIVTNRHVVPSGTTSVSVTLADGTRFDNVQVIGRTNSSSPQDIAFLKVTDLKGKKLVPATLGDSSNMKVGDKVIAIGNALGQFQNTVTTGIISGYGRDVAAGDQSGLLGPESLNDLFQTDAAINEGNSGGPLVNINGEVIGINTAIASGAQNIGFAQPVNNLKAMITGVLNSGELQQPYLGVRYVSLTNDIARQFNLKVNRGAYVVSGDTDPSIIPNSPAERAGLKDHDVISKVNNININDKNSLSSVLSKFKVGDTLTLKIVRDGKTMTVKATLADTPSD